MANRKTHLNFAGTSMVREQKTSEGTRIFDVRSRIDELYGEIRQKDSDIGVLHANSNEWKEKYEELVKENSMLRTKLMQHYGEDINVIKERHEKELQVYAKDLQKYRQIVAKNENEIITLRQELHKVDLFVKKYEELEKDWKCEKEKCEILLKGIEEKEKSIERLTGRNKGLDGEIRELEEIVKKLTGEIQEVKWKLGLKIEEIEIRGIEEVKAKLNEIEGLHEKIEVLNGRLLGQTAVIKTRDGLVMVLTGENQEFVKRIRELEEEVKKHEEIIGSEVKELNFKYARLKNDYEILQKSHQKCEMLKESQVKYERTQGILLESQEKYKNLKEKILKGFESVFSTFTPPLCIENLKETIQSDHISPLFSEFSSQILKEISKFQLLQTCKDASDDKFLILSLELSNLQLENSKLLNKLANSSKKFPNSDTYEQKLQLYEQKLQYEIELNAMHENKIHSQKKKIEKLQSEIKSSFAKIDLLKSQLEASDKNLILIQQLKEKNANELSQKQILQEKLEQLTKKLGQIESDFPKKSEIPEKTNINSILLQKIGTMKSELEQYNPSVSNVQQELKTCKNTLSNLYFSSNRLEFSLKNIEDDFKCKVCLKLENIEIFSCGHLNCIFCNKTCKDCIEPSYKFNTHVFYSISRRVGDMKRALQEIKSQLS